MRQSRSDPARTVPRELVEEGVRMMTLEELGAQVDRLAKVVGAPRSVLPALGQVSGYSLTRLEVLADGSLALSAVERGQVAVLHVTRDLDELMFQVFVPACSNMAMTWESLHRVPSVDFRAAMFARQLYLLDRLNPAWPSRLRPQLEGVLRERPYAHEDLAKAVADARAYGVAHAGEFDSVEAATVLGEAGHSLDGLDLDALRRLAVYVGLIKRGVEKIEARAVAAFTVAA
jgi:hypothetical protein